MKAVAPGLWTQEGDRIRLLGIPFDTRAVIARLPDGGLWLHSPVRPTEARLAEITALGPIRCIVAPNRIHGAYTHAWADAAPEAGIWVSPKFPRRHPGTRYDALLGDTPPPDWSETLDQCLFAGSVYLDEVVFLHRASGSLIVTDILQRHDPKRESLFWRAVKRWNNILAPAGGTARDIRLTVTDKPAARAARDRILGWEFDRILLPHGLSIETRGKAAFAAAMRWLD